MTHVVNFFAGPGSGKSTHAAALFAALKRRHLNVELVTEYAKDLVWEERFTTLENQIYVFGKQLQRMTRLLEKTELLITDSPLLFSIIYNNKLPACFNDTVVHVFKEFDNINYFLERNRPYQTAGRMQTEEEAIEVDKKILRLLKELDVSYTAMETSADPERMELLADQIMERIKS